MSQQVQPVDDVYPGNPNGIQPQQQQQQQQHSSHSNNGSFGPVFIVLGVIVALTIIATVLGRICSRRRHRGSNISKADQQQHAHGGGKKKAGGSGGRGKSVKPHDIDDRNHNNNKKFQRGSEGDIEFGFDKKIATSKVADLRGDHHPRVPYNNNNKPWQQNGETKGHVRFANDHIDFRAGH